MVHLLFINHKMGKNRHDQRNGYKGIALKSDYSTLGFGSLASQSQDVATFST